MNESHLVCQLDGPGFLSRLPPPRVRRGAAGRKEEKRRASTFFCTCMQDFLLYLEFEMAIWRFTFTSRKEIKLFFLTFHCTYILRKETDLECRERQFSLVCRERRFCAVEGKFCHERRFTNLINDVRQEL